MKKFGIIFLQLSFIILLFACSPGSNIKWVDENEVTIAWDPVNMAVDKGSEIRYLIYIDYSDQYEEMLVEKYVDGILVDENKPIAETSCTIEFKTPGEFFIGVQSVICNVENKSISKHSAIAWSDNKLYTHNNPFGIRAGR
jgi:hypothetical protein